MNVVFTFRNSLMDEQIERTLMHFKKYNEIPRNNSINITKDFLTNHNSSSFSTCKFSATKPANNNKQQI